METVLIKCPHCKEEMQAPADRESILCMFCGEKIDLEEAQAEAEKKLEEQIDDVIDSIKKKREENLQFVLGHVGAVCQEYREKVKAFKKDSYSGLFENHKQVNYAFYTSIKQVLISAVDVEELDSIYRQIAGAFIEEQKAALEQVRKKNDKFSMQMDKNMFMVIYVLPAIKEIRADKADRLAEVICEEWRKAFKDSNISAADYDSIAQGFKRKLCYVTTAVCLNLNKGEDCEELRLIKEFRDGYLSSTEEGQALIDEYYDIAPTLVKRIAKDAGAQEKYVWLWNTYIAPCVEYIKNGRPGDCKETYCDMMDVLRREYMPGRQQQDIR